MFQKFLFFVFSFISISIFSQELDCTVTVNSDKIPGSNKQRFETLQKELTEFINQKRWTNYSYKEQEKIKCNFTITLTQQSGNDFKGTLQVQSSRPVYNSVYLTPVFNFNDEKFSFQYTEFQPLRFNKTTFESNLVSTIAFYVYTIIGLDADTFKMYGGTNYLNSAQNVLVQAQQSGYKGWNRIDGNNTRYTLIDNLLSPTYNLFRQSLYQYHRKGLDEMVSDKKKAKSAIAGAIKKLKSIYNFRPNAFLLRIFMDAKADEIVNIYSGGPYFDTTTLKEDLNKISSLNSAKWNSIN
ncbi:MAG: type IX secretion system protein PorD [Lutibacter sp.]